MADLTITYQGNDIVELSDSGTKTLKTGGTYCEADIEVEYVKPSGGGDTFRQFMHDELESYTDDELTTIVAYRFYRVNGVPKYIRVPNATLIDTQAFYLSNGLESIFAPNALLGNTVFQGVQTLKTAVCKGMNSSNGTSAFRHYTGTDSLEVVDFTANGQGLGSQTFQDNTANFKLIFREQDICPMLNINAFAATIFDNGGTGGTIYIPKALYDHLGDGSSLDYKSATNWSTIDGYGTITWAQIEGSYYETHYADGTEITS